ncbi:MAG: beta-N-acetylglucosaminidase domain-containing protein [Acidimicrobiia bacterium]|nr:beta-N-acetylglucosaminidase domain-containing protein [Acidimicrobiia bacterium]
MTTAIRGVIEGFYGPPWSWDDRRHVSSRVCHGHGMTHYVYAPKDDPLHRARWREPYPDDELDHFERLVSDGTLEVGFAISPGLSIDYGFARRSPGARREGRPGRRTRCPSGPPRGSTTSPSASGSVRTTRPSPPGSASTSPTAPTSSSSPPSTPGPARRPTSRPSPTASRPTSRSRGRAPPSSATGSPSPRRYAAVARPSVGGRFHAARSGRLAR